MCIFATTKGVGLRVQKELVCGYKKSQHPAFACWLLRSSRASRNDWESLLSLGGDAHDVAVVNLDVDGVFQ